MEVVMSTYTKQELKDIFKESFQEIISNKQTKKNNTDLLDSQEVASIFKVSKGTINNWRKKGILKSYIIGRRRRFKQDEVYEALEQFMSNGGKLK